MATKTVLTTHPESPPIHLARGRFRPGRVLWVLLGVVLLLAGAGGAVAYMQAQDAAQRVHPAVQVAGVAVGGMTVGEAQAAITQHFAGLPDSQILVHDSERTWTFTARDLGIGLDAAATAQAAQQAGRNVVTVPDIAPVVTRDRAAAEATLHTVAADVAVAPQDATFTVDADGIRVVPAAAGHQLDFDATWQALQAATQSYPFGEVVVQTADVAPRVHDADVAPALATVHRLADTPITLTGKGADGKPRTWTLDPAVLRTWLQISSGPNGAPTVKETFDPAKVQSYLESVGADVKREAQNAVLTLPDYATTSSLTADVSGRQMNIITSTARLQAAATAGAGQRAVDLQIDPIVPTVQAAALQPLKNQLDAEMHNGLALTFNGRSYQITGAQVALLLYVEPSPAGAAMPYQITVHDNDITRLAAKVAQTLNQPAQNAAYRLVNNVVTLVQPPLDGLHVDQAQTGAAIKDALVTGKSSAPMAVTAVKPDFAAADQAGQISTPDLLKADSTFYGGSSPERNWNVTFGASKLDGWLIPPGGTFSLNQALGDLTLAAGFKMGWAIFVQGGSATTIPAEAGGICQVATTLFHPVFWSGLPIVERHHHSYWISLYGVAPLGMQGLDATISPPWSDFQFKNTTGNWLLIRAVGDHQNLRVELWGTNPGWKVQVDAPVVTNIVKTDTAPRTETSDKIEPGRKVQVEHAQDGFTSDIHRQVFDASGKKLDDWHAQGTYLPSHNTTVVGVSPAAPAAPSAAPKP